MPESIKQCKNAVEKDYIASDWMKIDEKFKYLTLESSYGKRKQRWVLVSNRASKYKELETFRLRLEKEEGTIKRSIKGTKNKAFFSKEEANARLNLQEISHPNFTFSHHITGVYKRVRGSKRKIRVATKS